ncbi:hypothetical protein SAMN05518672_107131 [Chitinophaga sp. CF118]|uniref:hypothetical protein n=1 Tax=Chitinophaga sp. CF118 TaxID=1884367 RepID=UPI0008EF9ED7|nr:hypothetical protein [Chitinophaga sp. CF118]SFE53582.1 hypothetical protein SAMN05518672_107131 [Chitinophaga sp. CF118]
MSKAKIFGLLSVAVVIISVFLPWLTVESKHLIFTGIDTAGSRFGEPGKLSIVVAVVTGILFLLPGKVGARFNLFMAAFLAAWSFRNFLLFSRCEMGECPDRGIGLYLCLVGAIAVFVCVLFTNGETKSK